MKRRLLKLGVFLLLGALMNIGVAWIDVGVPIVRANTVIGDRQHVDDYKDWRENAPSEMRVASNFLRGGSTYGLGLKRRIDWATPTQGRQDGIEARWVRIRAGWPSTALQGERWSWTETASGPLHIVSRGTLAIDEKRAVLLPCIPLWPGFAINTIFYAAILALLFNGPGKVRQMVRVRRFQCPACGHIIAAGTCANGLCSECGSPLPASYSRRPVGSGTGESIT